MKYIKYPEFEGWFKEGLFKKRQINGELWTVGRQMWYMNKVREKYFAGEVGCIWNIGKVGGCGDIPTLERNGWLKAQIKNGFKHVSNVDMRIPIMAMVLCSLQPFPKAHEISDECGFAWEQFKYEFAKGLFELYKARVGIYA